MVLNERQNGMAMAKILSRLVILAGLLSASGCGAADRRPAATSKETKPAEQATATGTSAQSQQPAGTSRAAEAIAQAEKAGRFLFLMFVGGDAGQIASMEDSLARAMTSLGDKADTAHIDATNLGEAGIMRKYGVGTRGSLPMILSLAPNGVVTGGYPGTVTTEQLTQSTTVSDLMLKVLKPLQENKVALVALQNAATKFNTESWVGVNDFASDTNYRKVVAAIKADPVASGSKEFVKQCQLLAPITQATVVILLPPGRIGKVLTGKLTKDDVLKALGSCATGCAPGGCSDRRFKEDIAPITSAVDKVARLQGVTFWWNQREYPQRFFSDKQQIGLIAQDVESVIPEVVRTDADGYKSITYDKLTAVLIEAVKEMNTKLATQDSLIRAQNSRIKALEAR